MSNANRWTNRLHAPNHDAQVAASRTSDVMARILEDLRMLDADELALPRPGVVTAADAFVSSRVG